MKQKSKGVYRTHIKKIKKDTRIKLVANALYWFLVGVAGVLTGQLLVWMF